MLTITYNHKKLYINISLIKIQLKTAIITLLKAFAIFAAIAGLFIILGTAGISDNGIISYSHIVIRIFYGFMCFGIAYVFNITRNALQ